MSEEKKSIFDEFEVDELTGEVLVPRAEVGVAPDIKGPEEGETGAVAEATDYIPAGSEEELPELHFDFDFGEEEFADTEETADEDMILQSIDEALAAQMAATMGPAEEEKENGNSSGKKKNIWQRIPKWCRAAMITVASLCLILLFLVGTKPGRKIIYSMVAGYVSDKTGGEDEVTPPPEATGIVNNVTPEPTKPVKPGDPTPVPTATPIPMIEPRHEEYVYNILLIGTEALPQFGGERSDTMILVSVNSKDNKIYMTSLMRDMYVHIPGHADHKLNAAYSHGGSRLLVETVEQNLQVKIDGYVKVGFDDFEWIIDRLGGVEITLTEEEAEYLNKTKYITKKEYRNVVPGTQLMNGNQVLGYCRVRKVPNINGTSSDFGRTERQRIVLTKLFNKYKETGIFTLLSVLNDCLPQVKTNISKADMQDLMEDVVENRILDLESFRIPTSGSFRELDFGGDVGKAIVPNWAQNIDALHKKIFGNVK
ncbi:MAG: LCP family protein [Lachnospiraceae bacterium]|nr:LCP family protein [Lachnospiraceae bacterium]